VRIAFAILALTLCFSVSAARAEPTVASAEGGWTPINLPMVGARAFLPCSEAEIAAYKNANEARRGVPGFEGCSKAGYTAIVMLLVNTPSGFFDDFVKRNKSEKPQTAEWAGHRSLTLNGEGKRDASRTRLIEFSDNRAVLLSFTIARESEIASRALADRFVNSLEIKTP
jgi:hypothetical protein